MNRLRKNNTFDSYATRPELVLETSLCNKNFYFQEKKNIF